MNPDIQTHSQASAYDSPWSFRRRLALLVWDYVWALTCSWTPKPFNPWRLLILKIFGAKIQGTPFVHQRARIQQPWNLTMHHRACLGDGATAYSLAEIILHEGCTIAQEVYLCTGTHAFDQPNLPLQTAPIIVGRDAFVGARAFILPGVTLGERSVVGAASVVTKDIGAEIIAAGNPARALKKR